MRNVDRLSPGGRLGAEAETLTDLWGVCSICYMGKRKTAKPTKAKPAGVISGPLWQAIVDSDLPLLRLEQATGVRRQSIMKFLSGERSLRLDIADKLAAYLRLMIPARRRRGKQN